MYESCVMIVHEKRQWLEYLENAAITKGKTAASVPPVTIRSTSPFLIRRKASPIAWAPAEHAVDGARFGPFQKWKPRLKKVLTKDITENHSNVYYPQEGFAHKPV